MWSSCVAGIVLLPLILAGPTLVEPGATAGSGDHRRPLLASRAARLSLHAGDALSLVGSGSYALAGRSARCRSHDGHVARSAACCCAWCSASRRQYTIYGPLAAPIALLIWLYVISLAVLIGAAFNSASTRSFPSSPASTTTRRTSMRPPPTRQSKNAQTQNTRRHTGSYAAGNLNNWTRILTFWETI